MPSFLAKFRKTLFICSAIIGTISMAAYGVLENTYVNYPRAPDQASGRVVAHKSKSVTVYLTQQQSEVIQCIVWILIFSSALVLISLFLNLKWPIDKGPIDKER
jgi:hypothetical protein